MKRRYFYAAAISGITLAAAAVLSPVAGASTGTFTGRDVSASHAGLVALQGRVVQTNGTAVAGARVRLYAWPASWPGKQVVRGQQVPLRLVGQAVSTASGRYAVRVAVPALRTSAVSGSIVNLQASIVGATGVSGFYPFSVRISSGRSGLVLASTRGVAEKVFRLPRLAARRAENRRDFCFVRHVAFIKNFKEEWGTVDETYMNRRGVRAQAKLVSGQTTTFGVGISGSGVAGSFSSSGTFTLKDSIGFTFKWYSGPSSQAYQVNFRPAKYKEYWTPGNCTSNFFTQPNEQLAGHRVISAGKIPIARHCDSEPPGTLSMTHSVASTISAAMTVAEIGFKASAQTGWSQTDTISYKSGLSKWWFCGVRDDPAGHPGRIVAGNRPR